MTRSVHLPAEAGSRRSRFTREVDGGLHLQERDRKLLADLFLHQAMSRRQLQTLYFGSVPRCNARLRQLFDHGYLARFFPPEAPFGAEAVYLPGTKAAGIVAADLGMDISSVRRRCRGDRSGLYLQHALAVVDFRIALQSEVAANPDMDLDVWLPELLCHHEYDIRTAGTGPWRKRAFKPDGFFRLKCADGSATYSFFLEVDLGHTSRGEFRAKVAMHREYLMSGLFRELYGAACFRSLVVTTSARRMHNLLALCGDEAVDLFHFSTFANVEQKGLLGNVWHRIGTPSPEVMLERDTPLS